MNQRHQDILNDPRQIAEKKYKTGVEMIKEGISARNHTLIRGGISFLQTAARIDERAMQCLSRLKMTANPAARPVIALQDPCQLHFSLQEISKLCEPAQQAKGHGIKS